MLEISYKEDNRTYTDILCFNEIDKESPFVNSITKIKDCSTGQILLHSAAISFIKSMGVLKEITA